MIVAWNEFMGKRFTYEEAEQFFGKTKEQLLAHIESGEPIPVGIRYWCVDELLEPEVVNEENLGQNLY